MREEVGGVVHREYHPPPPFILPRLQMQVEADALAHLHVWLNRRAEYFA